MNASNLDIIFTFIYINALFSDVCCMRGMKKWLLMSRVISEPPERLNKSLLDRISMRYAHMHN